MELKVVAAALGLPEDATEEQVTEAIGKNAADLEAAKTELAAKGGEDRIAKLETALAEERTLRLTSQRDNLLASAVRERRITPAQSEVFAKQFDPADNEKLATLVASFAPNTTGEQGTGLGAEDGVDVDTTPVTVQGTKIDVNPESAVLDAKARKLLADQGKAVGYTASEYLAALEAVAA